MGSGDRVPLDAILTEDAGLEERLHQTRNALVSDPGPHPVHETDVRDFVDEQDIAVTIETTSPAERTTIFGRAFGLSAREAELLSHLVSGSDTHHIAQQMFVSEHTVQEHLKSISARPRHTTV